MLGKKRENTATMKLPIESVVSKVMFWKGEVRVYSESGMRCLNEKKCYNGKFSPFGLVLHPYWNV